LTVRPVTSRWYEPWFNARPAYQPTNPARDTKRYQFVGTQLNGRCRASSVARQQFNLLEY
jgi:hypothetical protein